VSLRDEAIEAAARAHMGTDAPDRVIDLGPEDAPITVREWWETNDELLVTVDAVLAVVADWCDKQAVQEASEGDLPYFWGRAHGIEFVGAACRPEDGA